jgi:G3E family GTPase
MSAQQQNFLNFEREMINPLAGHSLSDAHSYVASRLLDATREHPLANDDLRISLSLRFDKEFNPREVKAIIEDLRREHRFPIVGSKGRKKSKDRPAQRAGYWWGDANDLREWYRRVRKESLKQLQTIEIVWAANFLEMEGQLTIEDCGLRNAESKEDYK